MSPSARHYVILTDLVPFCIAGPISWQCNVYLEKYSSKSVYTYRVNYALLYIVETYYNFNGVCLDHAGASACPQR
jgi:hypothetical protein